jgi:thiol:disulfide interchange protein DsbC
MNWQVHMTNRQRHPNRLLGTVLLGLLAATFATVATADEASPRDAVRAGLEKALPGLKPDSVRPSPVPNLYEVLIGPQVVYVSSDGRYLVQGSIIDLQTQRDLTEPRRRKAVTDAVEAVGEDKMIIFGEGDAQHTVTVFTDIDCGYCRKLHSEIGKFNKAGIRVRYLFFPRAGVKSDSYAKAVSVWCADDRNQALTAAKAGKPVPPKTCDNPVREHMALGEALGVSGTPAIVLPGGKVIPGYVPPDRLAAYLATKQASAE